MRLSFIRTTVLLAAVAGALALPAVPAHAQSEMDEFKAFREKVDAARGIASPADTPEAPVQDPQQQENPAAAAPDDSTAATAEMLKAAAQQQTAPLTAPNNVPGNPLGAAANLPLGDNNLPPAFGSVPQTPQELQAQMEYEAEMQKRKIEEQTFEAALKQLMPLRPEQVRRTLDVFRESREAAETPIADPAPKQVVETLSLDPSDVPATIKMSPGMVTTLTILDATGAPWPIQDISWAGKFQVTPPEDGGHIVRITPESAHGAGNLSMRLVDLVTPITITLRTGLDEVHYRFDARIPKPGPLAKPSIIEYGGLKALAGQDGDMEGILDGTPPVNAVKLKVDGADIRTTAWRSEGTGMIYLRTPLTLLSPGWDSSMSSADGMNVYSLGKTPVILLSDRGRMVRLRLAEDDEVTP